MNNQQTLKTNAISVDALHARPGRVLTYGRHMANGSGAVPVKYNEVESDTAGENITIKNALIRILLIPGLAFTSAIAWDVDPYYIIILAPTVFYLIFTAFTLYCPLTALWYTIIHPKVVNRDLNTEDKKH
jgi:hypothetical protein